MPDLINVCDGCARPVWHCDPTTCAEGARREAARQAETADCADDAEAHERALAALTQRDAARGAA